MYWLVSLPLLESADRTWATINNETTYSNDYSINFRFNIPELRVGTLDTLLVLSDDLVKTNALVEGVVNKIRRQLFEMGTVRGEDFQEVRPSLPQRCWHLKMEHHVLSGSLRCICIM